ncbi:I78 family peptidase inhibitor [Xinfangfangia pollutisoli]|uniref:I78 family peptidase inhibitor n=1 Tax=Xinfangfangia pollutisoli TaxID=2865960 RepID=UPI001CD1CE3B|nr:I78 family peptidase inhibitor [Xinfangfangia pollutisoli]
MTQKLILAAGMALGLSACVDPSLPQPEPEPDPNACGAADLQFLVGQKRSVLAMMSLPAPVRVIEPGMAVTMDYNADRLNIELDEQNRISRVYCS